jgi:hypothetical protein
MLCFTREPLVLGNNPPVPLSSLKHGDTFWAQYGVAMVTNVAPQTGADQIVILYLTSGTYKEWGPSNMVLALPGYFSPLPS